MNDTRLKEIYARIKTLESEKQSTAREQLLTTLNFEKRELESRREAERCSLAKLLFESYFKTGRMVAIRISGERLEGQPYPADGVQGVWNIRSEAEKLAAWSIT